MAMGSNNGQFMSDINVTPLVDVMLVLLIIFMVTAPMMMQGVNVALPQTTSKPLTTEMDHLTVTIDRGQQVFINDYKVALETLEALNECLTDNGVGLHLSEVKGPVMDRLERADFLEHLNGRVFLSQFEAWQELAAPPVRDAAE